MCTDRRGDCLGEFPPQIYVCLSSTRPLFTRKKVTWKKYSCFLFRACDWLRIQQQRRELGIENGIYVSESRTFREITLSSEYLENQPTRKVIILDQNSPKSSDVIQPWMYVIWTRIIDNSDSSRVVDQHENYGHHLPLSS